MDLNEPSFLPADTQLGWIKAEHSALRGAMMKFGYGRWDKIREYQSNRLADRPSAEIICAARRLVIRCLSLVTVQVEIRVLESIAREDMPTENTNEENEAILAREVKDATADVLPEDRRKVIRWARKIRMLRRLRDIMTHPSLDKLKAGELKIHTPVPAQWWRPQDDWSLVLGTFKYGYGTLEAIRLDPELTFAKRCSPPLVPRRKPGVKRESGTPQSTKDGANAKRAESDEDDEDDEDEEEEEDKASRGSALEAKGEHAAEETKPEPAAEPEPDTATSAKPPLKAPDAAQSMETSTKPESREEQTTDPTAPEPKVEDKVEQASVAAATEPLVPFPPSENIIRRIKSVIHACAKEVDRDLRAETKVREAQQKEKLKEDAKREALLLKKEKDAQKMRAREERKIAKSQPFNKRDAQEFEKALMSIGVDKNESGARDWEWFAQKTGALRNKYTATLEQAYQDLLSEAHRVIENREKASADDDENASQGSKDDKEPGASAQAGGQPKSVFNLTADRAEKLFDRLEFFRMLREEVLPHDQLAQILRGSRRPKELPVWWRSVHDRALLWGVDRHGVGDWEAVATDPELGFPHSIKSYHKKHPLPPGAQPDKKTAFPKPAACMKRAKGLLSFFRARISEFAKGPPPFSPEVGPKDEPSGKRLNPDPPEQESERPDAKRARAAADAKLEKEKMTRKNALLEKILVDGNAPTQFRPNKELEVITLGNIVPLPNFYTDRVIYPDGYSCRRTVYGLKYTCTISRDPGQPSRPMFAVIGPERSTQGFDPTSAWLQQMNVEDHWDDDVFALCGEERYGLFDPMVVAALQTRPGIDQCYGYFMRDFSTTGGGAVQPEPVKAPYPNDSVPNAGGNGQYPHPSSHA